MDGPVLRLPAELTINQVEQCRFDILGMLEDNDSITIDDSALVRIDTLGIQLLLGMVIQFTSQNKQLHWRSQSSLLKTSVKQLGLNEAILNQYVDD